MKTMQGACFFACSNMSRTRLAPTPTNISTKSEPEIVKNGHLGLARDRAREQRLAGAGAADHQHALRDLAAELLELGRVLQEVDDLGDLLLRLVDAGDVREGHADLVLGQEPRPALAERHRARARPRRPASGA